MPPIKKLRDLLNEDDNISLSSCKAKIEWLEKVNRELLKACKACEYITRTTDPAVKELRSQPWFERMRKAISKAEGEE